MTTEQLTTEFEEAAEIFATMVAVTDAMADLINNSVALSSSPATVTSVLQSKDCGACADAVEAALQTYNKYEAKYGKNLRN